MSDIPMRVYGRRARLALVVPSSNTVAEIEFWRLAPEGVSVHTSRMPFFAEKHENPFDEMEKHLPRVLEEANSAEPDVIAYGCAASSAKGDPLDFEARLSEQAGRPAVTAAAALMAALAAFGARRIDLVTPYPPSLSAKKTVFFAENGVEVARDDSIIVDAAQMNLGHMYRVPPETLTARAIHLAGDDVDAVVLSCCDMPSLDSIPEIEAATGKPVISSAQALFWRAARAAGIEEPIRGMGRLLVAH